MGKKKRGNTPKARETSRSMVSSGWRIVAVAALIICGILIWKLGISPERETTGRSLVRSVTVSPESFDSKFHAVVSQFRCACGGCGELPLVECECDMPRGAQTEKAFVREKLEQGLTVDEVIQAVDELYGHRIT